MSYAQAFNALQRELNGQVDVVPEGWFTAEQWAEQTGKTGERTRYSIRQAMLAKRMESKKFRVKTTESHPRAVPHYRIIEAK